jgi:transposase-like protein
MVNPKKREKRRTKYSEGLKRKISKEYLAGKASYAILAEEHGLANKGVVKEFVKWYKRQLNLGPNNQNQVKYSGKNQDSKSGDLQSNPKVERLKKELELERLRVEMLETMIDEAERVLLIDIRKKPGTNQ